MVDQHGHRQGRRDRVRGRQQGLRRRAPRRLRGLLRVHGRRHVPDLRRRRQTDWRATSTCTRTPRTDPNTYLVRHRAAGLQRGRRGRRPGELQGHVERGQQGPAVHPVRRPQHLMAGLADAASRAGVDRPAPAPRRGDGPGPGAHHGDARRGRPGAGRDPRRAAAAPPRPVRGRPSTRTCGSASTSAPANGTRACPSPRTPTAARRRKLRRLDAGPAHPPRLRRPGGLAHAGTSSPGWFTGPARGRHPAGPRRRSSRHWKTSPPKRPAREPDGQDHHRRGDVRLRRQAAAHVGGPRDRGGLREELRPVAGRPAGRVR